MATWPSCTAIPLPSKGRKTKSVPREVDEAPLVYPRFDLNANDKLPTPDFLDPGRDVTQSGQSWMGPINRVPATEASAAEGNDDLAEHDRRTRAHYSPLITRAPFLSLVKWGGATALDYFSWIIFLMTCRAETCFAVFLSTMPTLRARPRLVVGAPLGTSSPRSIGTPRIANLAADSARLPRRELHEFMWHAFHRSRPPRPRQ